MRKIMLKQKILIIAPFRLGRVNMCSFFSGRDEYRGLKIGFLFLFGVSSVFSLSKDGRNPERERRVINV